MIKYILDTNIVIYVMKRRPLDVLDRFNEHSRQMSISAITFAELIYGAEKSQKKEHNLKQVEDFVSRLEVLDYHQKAAAHYGDIRAVLEEKGRIIAANDLHSAAHARSEGLILVSKNVNEFEWVEGLRLENWIR